MDREKVNKFARMMAEDIIATRPSLPFGVAMNAVNYKMANICSQMGIKVDTRSGYDSATANLYLLTLAESGTGKNASLGLLDKSYFGDAFKYIENTVYPMFKDKAMMKLEKDENDRPIHSWTKVLKGGTASGMYAYAESFSLCKFGGINYEIDEIGGAVISKSDLFEMLLTPYDNGDFVADAKRSDHNAMNVTGMGVNLYCFGNKVRLFEGDNVESAFLKLLDEGYGRRMIFAEDNTVRTKRDPKDVMNEMKESQRIHEVRSKERDYIKSLVTTANMQRVLPLTDEAMMRYAIIKAEGENYTIDNKGLDTAVKSDYIERSFKTAKLACIYAFFEGSDCVTEKHMDEAFEIVKASSDVLEELRKIKPKHERLLDKLIEEDKPCTAQHLLSYPFIPSSWTKKIDEVIELAKQLSSEHGYIWKTTARKGVEYYEVRKPRQEDKVLDEVDKKEKEESKPSGKMSKEELIKFLEE